jgi:hypothetical protein
MRLNRFEHSISCEKYAFLEVVAAKEWNIIVIAEDPSKKHYILSFERQSKLSRVVYASKCALKDVAYNETYSLIMFKVDDSLMIFKDIRTEFKCITDEENALGIFSPDNEVVGISKKEEGAFQISFYKSINLGEGLVSKNYTIKSKFPIENGVKLFWSHLGLYIGVVFENRIKIFSIVLMLSVYEDEEKVNPLQVDLTPDDKCLTILHHNELKIISISGRSTLVRIELTNSPTMFRWGTMYRILYICGSTVLQLEA